MYYKKVNKNDNKAMFQFLKEHFEYYTMNSWNRETSIANNVKVYNLDIKGDYCKLLELLEINDYININGLIEDWELEHKNYKVGFNGRSGGYLVLYSIYNNKHILDDFIVDSDNYEDFKEYLKDYGYTLKNYHDDLVRQVELVQDFDRLCDNLVAECQYMLDNYEIVEEEIQVAKTIKVLKEKGEL